MRVLIVDDEPLARRGLRRELARIPGTECVGECRGCEDAVAAIVELRPDLVFLDIQLRRRTGFEVIEQIGVEAMPLVIFVTAYDRHAIRAFEVHAVDYVLKPVDPERLREAVERAARLHALEHGASLADRLEQLLHSPAANQDRPGEPATAHRSANRIVVRHGDQGRLAFVDLEAIDWIEADGNYVRVHVGQAAYPLRATMARMEQRVGADRAHTDGTASQFIRIRRSALVNTQAISSIDPYGRGMFLLNLRGGAKLVSSRYHQRDLRRLLRPDR